MNHGMIIAIGCLAVLALGALLVKAIFRLPPRPDDAPQSPAPRAVASPLAQAIASQRKAENLSGVHALFDGREAFAIRALLARNATQSLEAQYYIWHGDFSGRLLLKELLAAADRGVAVRLLIDDNTTRGEDALLRAAAVHPNLHIRLFNPFVIRRPRLINFLFDFARLNRRMHNKSFTADQMASVVGGRNVGDEYFAAREGMQYADADVLVVGKGAADISQNFASFWNAPSSYEAPLILGPGTAQELNALRQDLDALSSSALGRDYAALIEETALAQNIKNQTMKFDWVKVQVLSDDPAKGLRRLPRHKLLANTLSREVNQATTSLDLASAYFVPGKLGRRTLVFLSQRGVKVRALTNSLASTDVIPVHAGYARQRVKMLRGGVALYELKPSYTKAERKQRREERSLAERFGASSASIHAKIFVLDGRKVFISSFNFDPRSVFLNCEMGVLFESPHIVASLTAYFDALALHNSFLPFMDKPHSLAWKSSPATDAQVFTKEPGSSFFQRSAVRVISWLPIEWLL